MSSVRHTRLFNEKRAIPEGWYWALPSRKLKRKKVLPLRLLGRDLAIFRDETGRAQAVDAYCPHMGAHLAEGKVEGDGIRCFFHGWKFDSAGTLVDIPCQKRPARASIKTWPTAERYGLIWVYTGDTPRAELPYVPELRDCEVDAMLGTRFVKECHPNVVMINAIDEQHFNTVHNLPVDLYMETEPVSRETLSFKNTTCVPDSNLLTRTIGKFYAGALTYDLCYHFGTSGSVTLGPDLLHFHILFALRQNDKGQTEGQTITLTKKRPGTGRLLNKLILGLTQVVGSYFAYGDTKVFRTTQFDFKTPIKADHAIIDFVQHVEAQNAISMGSWEPLATSREGARHLEVLNG